MLSLFSTLSMGACQYLPPLSIFPMETFDNCVRQPAVGDNDRLPLPPVPWGGLRKSIRGMMPFNCLSKLVVRTGRNQLADLTGAKHPLFELSGDLSPEPPTWIRRWCLYNQTMQTPGRLMQELNVCTALCPLNKSYPNDCAE